MGRWEPGGQGWVPQSNFPLHLLAPASVAFLPRQAACRQAALSHHITSEPRVTARGAPSPLSSLFPSLRRPPSSFLLHLPLSLSLSSVCTVLCHSLTVPGHLSFGLPGHLPTWAPCPPQFGVYLWVLGSVVSSSPPTMHFPHSWR